MNTIELVLIAVGLSLDSFAVSISHGLCMKKVSFKNALIIGLYFGIFQAAMPLLGYLLGSQFADIIGDFDHWIAFILLAFIGGKMIFESFKKEGCADRVCPKITCKDRECPGRPDEGEVSLAFKKMLPLAIATSIDALAAGVSFAFIKVQIVPAVGLIGVITLMLSMIGVKVGSIFGAKFKKKAELIGGLILVLMGLKILIEHLGILVL